MRKQDLVKSVAGKANMPERQVDSIVQATFDAIRDSLAAGEEVTITGFGSFRISERGAREGRNPQTGERITIPSRKSPSFRPGTQLKRAVSGE
ncbi:MAG: HU family DNA-binding protein [Thermomicrobiales bacterium]|jgi:DNA-binding protein HU-beta|nr:HU family DNA-binding protein [Thermomicrobiales bacterium]MCO5175598.1 HU family DNA-binding protein [Thermomicrobiales bacterium]